MTKKAGITKIKIQPQDHVLVSKHEKISDKEKKELFKQYDVILEELPKISIKDAAIADLDIRENDIIKITRTNKTAYETLFYRRVIDE